MEIPEDLPDFRVIVQAENEISLCLGMPALEWQQNRLMRPLHKISGFIKCLLCARNRMTQFSPSNRIPEIYKSDDTVFHFTALKTAIEYILPDSRLRLAPRTRSNDPFEFITPFFGSWSERPPEWCEEEFQQAIEKENGLRFKLYEILRSDFMQVCFCKNGKKISENVSRDINYSEEDGFLKPRMWSQYGDGHEGICLAFSIGGLKKAVNNAFTNKTFCDEVEYRNFKECRLLTIYPDLRKLVGIGIDNYIKELFLLEHKKFLFRKHIDYKDEAEFRICVWEKDKEYILIDISNCLVGIIVGHKVPRHVYSLVLEQFGRKFETNVTFLNWDSNYHLSVRNQDYSRNAD